jgi:APA family basic amino acid/polyamine antiporter
MMYGQSRIFFVMARDGLRPRAFSRVSQRSGTQALKTGVTGVAIALVAGFFPLAQLADLANAGSLSAFISVGAFVMVLRRTRPDLQRAFRVPAAPVVGVLGAGACLYLFWQSFQANWHWMSGWIAIGLAIYFGYSRTHSKLNK